MKRQFEEEEHVLEEKLRSGAWEVRPMLPDGNCLFRAVADQVYADADMCDTVRRQTVAFERAFSERFRAFVAGEDFEAYVERMGRAGEEGDHPEIQAMAELYCRPIVVYSAESKRRMNVYQCAEEANAAAPPIRLLYVNRNHYNSIVDKERPSVGVGLGLPGLSDAAPKAQEVVVKEKVIAESEREDNEAQLLAAALKESELADEEQRLMQAALIESLISSLPSKK